MFRPIREGKLSETVQDQVRVLIYEGRLKPGARLPSERELAATFRIGRAAVREALKRLHATGFIVTRKRGSFVCPLTPATLVTPLEGMLCSEFARIEQLIEIRKSIEAVSAAEAAQKATAEDLAKIQGALRELLEAIQTGRLLEDGGLAFHLAIVEAAHNPSLLHVFQICATLMRSTQGITNLTRDAATARENYVGHEAISRAIRARDPVQARERMLSHLDAAKRAIHYLNPLLHRRPAS
jgi:GntR family transcriptional repressor for pyruvate dehydrogenase complex